MRLNETKQKPSEQALEAVKNALRSAAARGDGKVKVLFVCLGNICRSPAAEGVARKMAEERGFGNRFLFDSAGFYGGHAGDLPDDRMRRAAQARGYTLDHRSRTVRLSDYQDFDLILGMDDSNIDDLRDHALTDAQQAKIARMSDFAIGFSEVDSVPDPYWDPYEGFERVLTLIEDACSNLITILTTTKTTTNSNNQ